MMAVLAWAVWKERNERWKRNKSTSPTIVLKQSLRMLDLSLRENKCTKTHRTREEVVAYMKWDAYAMELNDTINIFLLTLLITSI